MFLIQKQWKHSVNHAKQRRNPFESIRKIWGHDWRVNVSYVLAHVFERVSTRPRLFQSDTTLHGAHYGIGHGVRHVAFHVGDVQKQEAECDHFRDERTRVRIVAMARPESDDGR